MSEETRRVTVRLALRRFSTAPQAIDEGCCVACGEYLDLHQPDAVAPDRLLGTCRRCGAWYLIDVGPDLLEAVMVLLPDAGSFSDAPAP